MPATSSGTLTITPRDTPAGLVLELSGEADVLNSGFLVETLLSHLPTGVSRLLVDVAQLAYIDSMALRSFVVAAKVVRNRGGWLTLIQPRDAVRRMLAITGADTYMVLQA